MLDIHPRLVFLILFVAGLAAFLYWDRKNVERHFILFYRRTDRGIELIDRIAKKAPRFWNAYGWAGVVTGILSIIISFALIAHVMVRMLTTGSTAEGPSLVLPGLVSENQFQAGVSFVPVEYWVIGIGILMVVHEMSHGIVARVEDFEINSVGWIVLGILPGAFVEPKGEKMLPGDDTEGIGESSGGIWEQGNWKSRIKVLSAGSFANYVTAVVFILLAAGASSAVAMPGDVVYSAQEGLPAAEAGMNNGSLYEINGETINTPEDVSRMNIQVGQEVTVWTSEGNFTMTAIEQEGREGGYIGIQVGQGSVIKEEYSEYQTGLQWLISGLFTIGLLNLMIGLFNMLPIKPLDGGLIVDTLLDRFAPERISFLNHFSLIGWALLLTAIVAAIYGGAI